MAKQLVDALASDFEPEKYHDAYREQLMSLIERKAAGEEIVAEPQVEEQGRVVDLMAALEQSLARAGRGGTGDEEEAEEELPPAATGKRAAKKRTRARKSA
jgi:DNA end-binding protein Ku